MQKIKTKLKTAQDIQDNIIRKMTYEERLKTASALTAFCLKLNRLNNDEYNRTNRICK